MKKHSTHASNRFLQRCVEYILGDKLCSAHFAHIYLVQLVNAFVHHVGISNIILCRVAPYEYRNTHRQKLYRNGLLNKDQGVLEAKTFHFA